MKPCTNDPRWANRLIVAALILGAAHSAATAQEESLSRISPGKQLFVRHCAPCHGLRAKGDGPAAAALNPAPPDLTRLRDPDGRFPAGRVFDVIEGDKVIPAHGSRTMPVWGVELRNEAGYSKSQQQIQLLVKYLESIQAEGG